MTFFISAIMMGFLSGGHCLGMCGPLVLALPVHETRLSYSIAYRILYNLGRIFTYVVLGGVTGLIGMTLVLSQAQARVAFIAGILLICFSLLQLLPFLHVSFLSRIHAALSRFFLTVVRKQGVRRFVVMGMVNGFLPCGMVAAALIVALSASDISSGMLYMLFFGLGTFPVMLVVSIFSMYISPKVRRVIAVVGPFYGIALGALLILRPTLIHPHCH